MFYSWRPTTEVSFRPNRQKLDRIYRHAHTKLRAYPAQNMTATMRQQSQNCMVKGNYVVLARAPRSSAARNAGESKNEEPDDGKLKNIATGETVTDPKIVGTQNSQPDPLAKTDGESFIPVQADEVKQKVTENGGDAAAQTGTISATNASRNNVALASLPNNSAGANVQQYAANGTRAQKWIAIKNGDSIKLLSAVAEDRALDVLGGSTSDGANVQIYSDNGTKAQRWVPVKQRRKSHMMFSICIMWD